MYNFNNNGNANDNGNANFQVFFISFAKLIKKHEYIRYLPSEKTHKKLTFFYIQGVKTIVFLVFSFQFLVFSF